MKAVVKYGYGKGETEIREVPVPQIGDDDILIEVKAAGVCGSDIGFDNGGHEDLLNCPVVLGHEFSGVIAAVGKNVTDWKVGERVVSDNTGKVCGKCYSCETKAYLVCPERLGLGYGMDGGFTKYVKIYGETLRTFPGSLFRIPECMSFEEAAIMDPVCNSYRAVVQDGGILPGEFVAVYGMGPIGLFAIQAARVAGAAKIIAIGLEGDKGRAELAKKLGATHVIIRDEEDLVAKTMEITGGEGVALAVDAAGPANVLQSAVDIIRAHGKFVKIGYEDMPLGFSLDCVVNKAIHIKGHYGYDWVSWKNCFNLIEAGLIDVKSVITHTMKLSDFRKAFDMVRSHEAVKIILYPED
jgi:threonine dehydrogenase-like Zn-dependent dehydrogenase